MYHSCRFLPSCSQYAIDALKVKGFFKGLFYIGKRLLKCHPFYVSKKIVDNVEKK